MNAKNARLMVIALLRDRGMKISHSAGVIGLARKLGFDIPPGDKSSAGKALVAYVASCEIKGSEVAHKPRNRQPRKALNKKPPEDFYMSRNWREARYQALVKHGGRCQCCGRSAKDGTQIHVDHIKPRSKFPALELDVDNLQVLCSDCNLGKSNTDQTDWRTMNEYSDASISKLLASF